MPKRAKSLEKFFTEKRFKKRRGGGGGGGEGGGVQQEEKTNFLPVVLTLPNSPIRGNIGKKRLYMRGHMASQRLTGRHGARPS